jgi:hypothetical protein
LFLRNGQKPFWIACFEVSGAKLIAGELLSSAGAIQTAYRRVFLETAMTARATFHETLTSRRSQCVAFATSWKAACTEPGLTEDRRAAAFGQ